MNFDPEDVWSLEADWFLCVKKKKLQGFFFHEKKDA